MANELVPVCPMCGGKVERTAIDCPHCGERLVGGPTLPGNADELRRELAELKASRRRHNMLGFAFGLPGLALQGGGIALAASEEVSPAVSLLVRLIGLVLLGVGIGFVAVYKGRNPAWALLSLIGCIGLLVMLVLKDYNLARIKEIESVLASLGRPAV